MNTAEIKGIIEGSYNIKINKITNFRDKCAFESGDGGQYMFMPTDLSQERILYTCAAQIHLRNCGFSRTNMYLRTVSGEPFIHYNDVLYMITPVLPGRECNLEFSEDRSAAAKCLASMHNASRGFTSQRASKIISVLCPKGEAKTACAKSDFGRLPEVLRRRTGELERFGRIAKRGNGRFDHAYRQICSEFTELAGKLCDELESSDYSFISDKMGREGYICHKNFSGHNVKIGPEIYMINFEECRIDMPSWDVVSILKKTLKVSDWSENVVYDVLNDYSSVRVLDAGELAVIRILFKFPQKIWRIVNKYYNSNRTWGEKINLEKLNEAVAEQKKVNEIAAVI